MVFLDPDSLLTPLEGDAPCGADLEYDPQFGELLRAAEGRPEQQMGDLVQPGQDPDWRQVTKLGKELFGRTRDLRIAMLMTRAGLALHGLAALGEGLRLVRGLLERHWDHVHPQLDAEDDNDPTMRVNVVAGLADQSTFLRGVMDAELVGHKVLGHFSLRDLRSAKEPASAAEGDGGAARPNMQTIDAAFLEADIESLELTSKSVAESIEAVAGVDAIFAAKVRSDQAPNLDALPTALREMQSILQDRLARRGVGAVGDDPSGAAAMDPASNPGASAAGPRAGVNSRDDAIRALDEVCAFFHRNEPSSPVPVLLQRAKRLVSKDFFAILQDIAPDGANQFQVFRGAIDDDG